MWVSSSSNLFASLFLAASVALASGCGATITVVDCDEGEVFCGDVCVDLDTDPMHCGACGQRCVADCNDGICESVGAGTGGGGTGGDGTGGTGGTGGGGTCGELTDCDGTCVDLTSDEQNCGACGVPCGFGTLCEGASCISDPCTPLATCNDVCTDVLNDPFNCLTCGNVCPSGECINGACTGSCGPGLADCNGTCVDLSHDHENCGGCGIPCAGDEICQGFSCVGGTSCDLQCGLCQLVELPSVTQFSTGGITAGVGDGSQSSCANGEPGVPDIGHHFVAPVSGTYIVDTFGSTFDTVLSALVACGEVTCSDDVVDVTSEIRVFLSEGQDVIFVVDGYYLGAEGAYQLNLRLEGGPECPPGFTLCGEQCVDIFSDPQHCGGCFSPCNPGDACIDASCQCAGPDCGCDDSFCGSCSSVTVLPSLVPIDVSGSTTGEDDGLQPSCVEPAAPESLFLYTAPFAASYTFDTFGSPFDTVLSIRSAGGCGELACNDDAEDVQSFIEMPLEAGQQILVTVDGYGDSGPFDLHIEADVPLCAPILEGPLPILVQDTTAGQPNTFSTSCIGGSSPDRTYHFVAPTSKLYTFDMDGTSYDPVLEVLNGTCGGPSLGCNDDFRDTDSHLEIPLAEGQLVTIVVDGFDGDFGDFRLTIQ